MLERWKKIKEYPDYFVSSLGRIKSFRWGKRTSILKPTKNENGYLAISFYCDNKKRRNIKIHRLVAKAFIKNPKKYLYVNHKNGVKTDNNIDNLEWCSKSYDLKHAYKNGLRKVNVVNMLKARFKK